MSTVLVTGGSGFIASWCVLQLPQAWHDVRTDLQADEGGTDAVAGCEYVLPVASPTLRNGSGSEAAVVSAARDGVLRVLRGIPAYAEWC